MKTKRNLLLVYLMILSGLVISACYSPMNPQEINALSTMPSPDRSIPVAALDYHTGDLTDPAVMAKYARADLLVLGSEQFWESDDDLDLIRAANPNIKIVAYFRTKCIRAEWGDEFKDQTRYSDLLYQTAIDHLVYTTEGDTASDWYNTYLYDFTDPEVRGDMLDIFVHFQTTSANQFDGVFWDYFAPRIWFPLDLPMEGEPDMDQDGVAHRDDEDEMERFRLAQEDWIDEMRAAMGEDFIQIANGVRALRDSTFAAKVDGMFYEDFPAQGFNGADEFRMALDPSEFNNLFAARNWPITRNGGPWLILSHVWHGGYYFDTEFNPVTIDADDLTRAVAMLTDASAITYEEIGERHAGIPEVEYNLGQPLGGVTIDGNLYLREFEKGRIELNLRSGAYPKPFDFVVYQDGEVLHTSPYPALSE